MPGRLPRSGRRRARCGPRLCCFWPVPFVGPPPFEALRGGAVERQRQYAPVLFPARAARRPVAF